MDKHVIRLLIVYVLALFACIALSCSFKEVVMRRDITIVVKIDTITHDGKPVKFYTWVDGRGGVVITTYEPMSSPFKVGDTCYSFFRQ